MTTAFEAAREQASRVDPREAARRCGLDYRGSHDKGEFEAVVLGRGLTLSFPAFSARWIDDGSNPDERLVTLLLYHLAISDGTPPANEWISFADLPDGRFYCSSWRGYTGRVLAAHFGSRLEDVRTAAIALGGTELDLSADLSFRLHVLLKVPVALLYWAGDEEFQPRADFLFDAAAPHHLSTDCWAVLCAWLTQELVGIDPGG